MRHRRRTVKHKFVELIPADRKDGIVYVSVKFATAVHNCLCGCRNKVVTPLSPTDWQLTFDGETISLHPSIGNWSFECRSHYWIIKNRAKWAREWSDEEIASGRSADALNKEAFFKKKQKHN